MSPEEKHDLKPSPSQSDLGIYECSKCGTVAHKKYFKKWFLCQPFPNPPSKGSKCEHDKGTYYADGVGVRPKEYHKVCPFCPQPKDSEAVAEPCAFNCGPTMSGETVKIDKDLPIAQLWKLLDDIDTASDMFKPSTEKSFRNFYNYTMKKVSERFKYLTSDGYDLFALRQERERGKL